MNFTTFMIFISGCSVGVSTQENQTYVYKKPYHYGMINKSILFDNVKYPWFIKEYNQYNPSINELNRLNYEKIKADAVITNLARLPIAVITADCVPILLLSLIHI